VPHTSRVRRESEAENTTVEPYLIAGLGNPGPRYAANRHNVGFHCVERLGVALGLTFDKRQKQADVALGSFQARRVILARPQTFMNEIGRAVAPLARFYQVLLEHLLVVYDDLDLPLGTLRLRPGGGSGGHKGMRSVIEHLGTLDFPRLRIGIGRPPGQMDPAAYVLQDFSADEEPLLEETLERAVAAIETWLREGIEAAMEQYNRRPG
jgi:PTH1 family peptidyl-tRNA hydrolase